MKRTLQLDFIRGLFLIVIAIVHFLSWENIIIKFTNEILGWVSAAEGFVFLSGLTAGLVYTHKYIEKGEKFISVASRKRAWLIYKYHVILFLAAMLIMFTHDFMQSYWRTYHDLIFENPFLAVFLGSLLIYQPTYMDILPMYAIFILFIPITIRYFQRGYHWQVLALSFSIYLLGTFNPATTYINSIFAEYSINTGYFNILCWQPLFISGLFFGFLFYHGKTKKMQNSLPLFYIALSISVPFFIVKFFYSSFFSAYFTGFDVEYWTSKEYLRPLRLLNFTVLSIVITSLATRYAEWFKFKPLVYLGRYSLEVFAFHILVVVLMKPLSNYLNTFYAIKLTERYYLYPFGSILLLVVLLSLFLAPTLMDRKTYSLKKASKQVT